MDLRVLFRGQIKFAGEIVHTGHRLSLLLPLSILAFSGIVKERISAQAGAQLGLQGREDALHVGVGRPTDGFAARGSPEILNARRK